MSTVAGDNRAEAARSTTGAWLVQAIAIFLVVGVISTRLARNGVRTSWSRGALDGATVLLSDLAMLGFHMIPGGWISVSLMVSAILLIVAGFMCMAMTNPQRDAPRLRNPGSRS